MSEKRRQTSPHPSTRSIHEQDRHQFSHASESHNSERRHRRQHGSLVDQRHHPYRGRTKIRKPQSLSLSRHGVSPYKQPPGVASNRRDDSTVSPYSLTAQFNKVKESINSLASDGKRTKVTARGSTSNHGSDGVENPPGLAFAGRPQQDRRKEVLNVDDEISFNLSSRETLKVRKIRPGNLYGQGMDLPLHGHGRAGHLQVGRTEDAAPEPRAKQDDSSHARLGMTHRRSVRESGKCFDSRQNQQSDEIRSSHEHSSRLSQHTDCSLPTRSLVGHSSQSSLKEPITGCKKPSKEQYQIVTMGSKIVRGEVSQNVYSRSHAGRTSDSLPESDNRNPLKSSSITRKGWKIVSLGDGSDSRTSSKTQRRSSKQVVKEEKTGGMKVDSTESAKYRSDPSCIPQRSPMKTRFTSEEKSIFDIFEMSSREASSSLVKLPDELSPPTRHGSQSSRGHLSSGALQQRNGRVIGPDRQPVLLDEPKDKGDDSAPVNSFDGENIFDKIAMVHLPMGKSLSRESRYPSRETDVTVATLSTKETNCVIRPDEMGGIPKALQPKIEDIASPKGRSDGENIFDTMAKLSMDNYARTDMFTLSQNEQCHDSIETVPSQNHDGSNKNEKSSLQNKDNYVQQLPDVSRGSCHSSEVICDPPSSDSENIFDKMAKVHWGTTENSHAVRSPEQFGTSFIAIDAANISAPVVEEVSTEQPSRKNPNIIQGQTDQRKQLEAPAISVELSRRGTCSKTLGNERDKPAYTSSEESNEEIVYASPKRMTQKAKVHWATNENSDKVRPSEEFEGSSPKNAASANIPEDTPRNTSRESLSVKEEYTDQKRQLDAPVSSMEPTGEEKTCSGTLRGVDKYLKFTLDEESTTEEKIVYTSLRRTTRMSKVHLGSVKNSDETRPSQEWEGSSISKNAMSLKLPPMKKESTKKPDKGNTTFNQGHISQRRESIDPVSSEVSVEIGGETLGCSVNKSMSISNKESTSDRVYTSLRRMTRSEKRQMSVSPPESSSEFIATKSPVRMAGDVGVHTDRAHASQKSRHSTVTNAKTDDDQEKQNSSATGKLESMQSPKDKSSLAMTRQGEITADEGVKEIASDSDVFNVFENDSSGPGSDVVGEAIAEFFESTATDMSLAVSPISECQDMEISNMVNQLLQEDLTEAKEENVPIDPMEEETNESKTGATLVEHAGGGEEEDNSLETTKVDIVDEIAVATNDVSSPSSPTVISHGSDDEAGQVMGSPSNSRKLHEDLKGRSMDSQELASSEPGNVTGSRRGEKNAQIAFESDGESVTSISTDVAKHLSFDFDEKCFAYERRSNCNLTTMSSGIESPKEQNDTSENIFSILGEKNKKDCMMLSEEKVVEELEEITVTKSKNELGEASLTENEGTKNASGSEGPYNDRNIFTILNGDQKETTRTKNRQAAILKTGGGHNTPVTNSNRKKMEKDNVNVKDISLSDETQGKKWKDDKQTTMSSEFQLLQEEDKILDVFSDVNQEKVKSQRNGASGMAAERDEEMGSRDKDTDFTKADAGATFQVKSEIPLGSNAVICEEDVSKDFERNKRTDPTGTEKCNDSTVTDETDDEDNMNPIETESASAVEDEIMNTFIGDDRGREEVRYKTVRMEDETDVKDSGEGSTVTDARMNVGEANGCSNGATVKPVEKEFSCDVIHPDAEVSEKVQSESTTGHNCENVFKQLGKDNQKSVDPGKTEQSRESSTTSTDDSLLANPKSISNLVHAGAAFTAIANIEGDCENITQIPNAFIQKLVDLDMTEHSQKTTKTVSTKDGLITDSPIDDNCKNLFQISCKDKQKPDDSDKNRGILGMTATTEGDLLANSDVIGNLVHTDAEVDVQTKTKSSNRLAADHRAVNSDITRKSLEKTKSRGASPPTHTEAASNLVHADAGVNDKVQNKSSEEVFGADNQEAVDSEESSMETMVAIPRIQEIVDLPKEGPEKEEQLLAMVDPLVSAQVIKTTASREEGSSEKVTNGADLHGGDSSARIDLSVADITQGQRSNKSNVIEKTSNMGTNSSSQKVLQDSSSNPGRMTCMSLHLEKPDVSSARKVDISACISKSPKYFADMNSSSSKDVSVTPFSAGSPEIYLLPENDRQDSAELEVMNDGCGKTSDEYCIQETCVLGSHKPPHTFWDQNKSDVFKMPLDSFLAGNQSEEGPPRLDRFDGTYTRPDFNSSSSDECSMPVIVCVKSVPAKRNEPEKPTEDREHNPNSPGHGIEGGTSHPKDGVVQPGGEGGTISDRISNSLSCLEENPPQSKDGFSSMHDLPVIGENAEIMETDKPSASLDCSSKAVASSTDNLMTSDDVKNTPFEEDELGIDRDVDVIDGFSFVSFTTREDLVAFTFATSKRSKSTKNKKKTPSTVTGIAWAMSKKKKPLKKTPPKKHNIFPTALKEQSGKLIEKYEEQFRKDLMARKRHEILHPALLKKGVSIKRSLDYGIPLLIDLELLDIKLEGKRKHNKESKKRPTRFISNPVEMLAPSPPVGGFSSDEEEDDGFDHVSPENPIPELEETDLQSRIHTQSSHMARSSSANKGAPTEADIVVQEETSDVSDAPRNVSKDCKQSKDEERPRDVQQVQDNLQEILARENAIFRPFEKPVLSRTSPFLSTELDTYLKGVSTKRTDPVKVTNDKERKVAPSRHMDRLNSAIQGISFSSLVKGKSSNAALSREPGQIYSGKPYKRHVPPANTVLKLRTTLLKKNAAESLRLKRGTRPQGITSTNNATSVVAWQSKSSQFLNRLVSTVKKATDPSLASAPMELKEEMSSGTPEVATGQKGNRSVQVVYTSKEDRAGSSATHFLPVRDPTTQSFRPIISKVSKSKVSPKMTRKKRKQLLQEQEITLEYPMPRDYEDIPGSPALCGNDFCRLGCICESLERATTETATPQHCHKAECMFECSCERFPSLRILRARKRPAIFYESGMVFYDEAGLLSDRIGNKKRMLEQLDPCEETPPLGDNKTGPVSVTTEKGLTASGMKEPAKSTMKILKKDSGFARGRIYMAKHIRYANKMEERRSGIKREAEAVDISNAATSIPPLKVVKTSDGYALQSSPSTEDSADVQDKIGLKILKRVDKMLVQSHRYRIRKSKDVEVGIVRPPSRIDGEINTAPSKDARTGTRASADNETPIKKGNVVKKAIVLTAEVLPPPGSVTDIAGDSRSLTSERDVDSNSSALNDTPLVISTSSHEPDASEEKCRNVSEKVVPVGVSRSGKLPRRTQDQETPKLGKSLSFVSSSSTSGVLGSQANRLLQEHFANSMMLKNISGVNPSSSTPGIYSKSLPSLGSKLTRQMVSNAAHHLLSNLEEGAKAVSPTASAVTSASSPATPEMSVPMSMGAPVRLSQSLPLATSTSKAMVPVLPSQPVTSVEVQRVPLALLPNQSSFTDKKTSKLEDRPIWATQIINSLSVLPPPGSALPVSVPKNQVPMVLLTNSGHQTLVLGNRLPQTAAKMLQDSRLPSGKSTSPVFVAQVPKSDAQQQDAAKMLENSRQALSQSTSTVFLAHVPKSSAEQSVLENPPVLLPQPRAIAPKNSTPAVQGIAAPLPVQATQPLASGVQPGSVKSVPAYWFKDKNGKPLLLVPISSVKKGGVSASVPAKPKSALPLCQLAGDAIARGRKIVQPYGNHRKGCIFVPNYHTQNPNKSFHLLIEVITNTQQDWRSNPLLQVICNMAASMKPPGMVRLQNCVILRVRFKKHVQVARCINVSSSVARNCTKKLRIIGLFESVFLMVPASQGKVPQQKAFGQGNLSNQGILESEQRELQKLVEGERIASRPKHMPTCIDLTDGFTPEIDLTDDDEVTPNTVTRKVTDEAKAEKDTSSGGETNQSETFDNFKVPESTSVPRAKAIRSQLVGVSISKTGVKAEKVAAKHLNDRSQDASSIIENTARSIPPTASTVGEDLGKDREHRTRSGYGDEEDIRDKVAQTMGAPKTVGTSAMLDDRSDGSVCRSDKREIQSVEWSRNIPPPIPAKEYHQVLSEETHWTELSMKTKPPVEEPNTANSDPDRGTDEPIKSGSLKQYTYSEEPLVMESECGEGKKYRDCYQSEKSKNLTGCSKSFVSFKRPLGREELSKDQGKDPTEKNCSKSQENEVVNALGEKESVPGKSFDRSHDSGKTRGETSAQFDELLRMREVSVNSKPVVSNSSDQEDETGTPRKGLVVDTMCLEKQQAVTKDEGNSDLDDAHIQRTNQQGFNGSPICGPASHKVPSEDVVTAADMATTTPAKQYLKGLSVVSGDVNEESTSEKRENPIAEKPLLIRSVSAEEHQHTDMPKDMSINDAYSIPAEKYAASLSRTGLGSDATGMTAGYSVTPGVDGKVLFPKGALDEIDGCHITSEVVLSVGMNEPEDTEAPFKCLEGMGGGVDSPVTSTSRIAVIGSCPSDSAAVADGNDGEVITLIRKTMEEPAEKGTSNNMEQVEDKLTEKLMNESCNNLVGEISNNLIGKEYPSDQPVVGTEETPGDDLKAGAKSSEGRNVDKISTEGGKPVVTGVTEDHCDSGQDASQDLPNLVESLSSRVAEVDVKDGKEASIAKDMGEEYPVEDDMSSASSTSDDESDVESISEEEIIPERKPWFDGATSCTLRLTSLVDAMFGGKKPFEPRWPTGFLDRTGWTEGTPNLRRFETSFLGEIFSGGGMFWPLKSKKNEIRFMSPTSMISLLNKGEQRWQEGNERARKLAEAAKPSYRELPPSQRLPKRDKVRSLEYCIADKKLDDQPGSDEEAIDVLAYDDEEDGDSSSDGETIYTTSSYEDEQRQKNDSLFKLAEVSTYTREESKTHDGKGKGLSLEESNKKCLQYVSSLGKTMGRDDTGNNNPVTEDSPARGSPLLTPRDVMMAMGRDSYGVSSGSATGSLTSSPTGSRKRKADMQRTRAGADEEDVAWEIKVASDDDDEDNGYTDSFSNRLHNRPYHTLKERARRASQRQHFLTLSRILFSNQPEIKPKVTILVKGIQTIAELKTTSERLKSELKAVRCHNYKQQKRLKEILENHPHLMNQFAQPLSVVPEGSEAPSSVALPSNTFTTIDDIKKKLFPEMVNPHLKDAARAVRKMISAMGELMARPVNGGQDDICRWTMAGLLDAGHEQLPDYLQNKRYLNRPLLQLKNDPLTPSQRGRLEKAERWRKRRQAIQESLPPLDGTAEGNEQQSGGDKSSSGEESCGEDKDKDIDVVDDSADQLSSLVPPLDCTVVGRQLDSLKQEMNKYLDNSSVDSDAALYLSQPDGNLIPLFPEKTRRKKSKESKKRKRKRASNEWVGNERDEGSVKSLDELSNHHLSDLDSEEELKKLKKKKKKKKKKRRKLEQEHSPLKESFHGKGNLTKDKKRKRPSEESKRVPCDSADEGKSSVEITNFELKSTARLSMAKFLEVPLPPLPIKDATPDWLENEPEFESTVTVDAYGNASTSNEETFGAQKKAVLEPPAELPFGDSLSDLEEEGDGWIDDDSQPIEHLADIHNKTLNQSINSNNIILSDGNENSSNVILGNREKGMNTAKFNERVDVNLVVEARGKQTGSKADRAVKKAGGSSGDILAAGRPETREVQPESSRLNTEANLTHEAAGASRMAAYTPKEGSAPASRVPEITEDINVDIKKIIPCLQVEEKDDGTLDVVLQGEYSDERLDELFALPGVMDYLRKAAAKKATKSQTLGPPR